MNLKKTIIQFENAIDQQKEEFASLNATVGLVSQKNKNQI